MVFIIIIKLILVLVLLVCIFFVARLFLYRTALIHAVRKWVQWIEDRIHVHQHLRVPELNDNGQPNTLYRKVYLYVNSLASLEDSDFTNLFSGKKSNDILLHLDDHQLIHDTFLGATISWTNHIESLPLHHPQDHRIRRKSFVLKIKKKDKRRILRPYLQHIHTVSDDIEQRTKEIKLFINCSGNTPSFYGRWISTPFTHPSTFDTIIMDVDLKNKVKSDLDTFLKSEQYYHKLGRVWKRSYLLYGPSGTGKSSFIAAMANYLSFDVYDVDLSRVSDDSDLKMLLLQTSRKSIIVIEDLDIFFAADENSSSRKLSLAGLLNFMDGIVNSTCGDEKVMVFTVSSKEHLDAAVLRPGRIDVHIHFPLCDFSSFKTLANSYLGVKDHKLFPQVEEMFQSGATISPAEIGELMLVHRSSPSRALKSVITALQSTGGKNPRRSSENTSSQLPTEEHGVAGALAWKETAPAKEFRKLYGLLRLKSSKKSGPLDQDHSELIER
ncbi:hypothetical protein ACH5RR_000039 [Cinchona calisaya]|uniref:AAA+ ATPase domain-containing protein n=1 Tax=Cinchona calisaya TaxID=153742 RepID=A0ABD3B076_9GENT